MPNTKPQLLDNGQYLVNQLKALGTMLISRPYSALMRRTMNEIHTLGRHLLIPKTN